MNIGVYSILDRKAGAYGELLFFTNDAIAHRAIAEVMTQPSNYTKYPEDFDMYHVGFFDNETGIIRPCEVRFVSRFADFAAKED